jgi:hypothetical protein
MTINNKADEFETDDLVSLSNQAKVSPSAVREALAHVCAVVGRWPEFAERAAIPEETATRIARTHRLDWA